MKLGMIYPCQEDSFDKAKELGLDFIEFDLNHPKFWGVDVNDYIIYADQFNKKIKETGVFVGAIGRWASQIFDKDGNIIYEELSQMKKCIDFANLVNCNNYLCSVNYSENISYFKNLSNSINLLKEIVDYAKSKNVTVSIVNCMMGDNYIRTPEQWKIVLEEIPDLRIKYDPSHSFVHGGENGAYMNETLLFGDKFGYVHIKGVVQSGDSQEEQSWKIFKIAKENPQLDKLLTENNFIHSNYDNPPAGLDSINWRAFFGALYKHNYDGLLSIEPHSPSWTGEKGDKGVKFTINYIRSLMI